MTGIFSLNPITGQLDEIGSSGGGGGGISTLVPDSGGGITGTSIDVVGQIAGSAMAMQTLNNGGELSIENRVWQTPYVVDPNTTPGLRGTYSTIQSAMVAAVADGMTFTNPKLFILRNASYVEDLTIYPGSYLLGGIDNVYLPSLPQPCTIQGNHTLPDVSVFFAKGVHFQQTSLDTSLFTGGSAACYMSFKDCVLTTISLTDISGGTYFYADGCKFSGSTSSVANLQTNGGGLILRNSDIGGIQFDNTAGGSSIQIDNCISVGKVRTAAYVSAINSSFLSEDEYNISSTGSGGNIRDCYFNINNSPASAAILSENAAWVISNCSTNPQNGPLQILSDPATLLSPLCTKGNLLLGIRTATDYTSSKEGYVGVTDTSVARTITLEHFLDIEVTIADESLLAGTNNITIVDGDGGLFSGSASLTISSNGGAARVHAIPGGNWIVV